MKKIFPIIVIIGLAFAGIYMFGDAQTKEYADDAVDTGKDAADKVGDKANPDTAVDGARDASDWLAGLPESFWRVVVPLLIVGGAVIWVWKDAKRRSIALGVAVIGLLAFIIAQTTR